MLSTVNDSLNFRKDAVKHSDKNPLMPSQQQALREIKRQVSALFDVKSFVLYGSVARGQADEESDIDLLVVTAEPLSHPKRHEISDVVFEVNLQFDTNFSTLVVDQKSWESGFYSILPIKDEIVRDGIPV